MKHHYSLCLLLCSCLTQIVFYLNQGKSALCCINIVSTKINTIRKDKVQWDPSFYLRSARIKPFRILYEFYKLTKSSTSIILPLSIFFSDTESFEVVCFISVWQHSIYSKSESAHMVSISCSFVILAKGLNQGLDPTVLRFRFRNFVHTVRNSHCFKKMDSANMHKKSVKSSGLMKDLKFQFKTTKISFLHLSTC